MQVLLPVAVVALLVLALAPAVSGQVVDWTRQFGSASEDIAYTISVDASGVYMAGRTLGALPGSTSLGDVDAFVRKYDAAGTEVWTRQFGTASGDGINGISVDVSGVYVFGYTGGALPGQSSSGDVDAFIRKYDAAGTEVWTRQFGSLGVSCDGRFVQRGASPGYDEGIYADASGVYVAGYTWGALPGQCSSGGTDTFVRKYDAAGTAVWTRQFGTNEHDVPSGVSVDPSGVYVIGQTYGALAGPSSGAQDVFVRKYNDAGTEVWTRQFGSSTFDGANGISVDASGLYVSGYTYGALPGQSSLGDVDAFVRKYDTAGTEVWTRQFGTASADFANGNSVDASGVYVTGRTLGALPGQTSSGGEDAFVRKYDYMGTEVWTRQIGTASNDVAEGISVDASGVYVAGLTTGTLPGQTSSGGTDALVVKLSLGDPPETMLNVPSAPLNLAAVAGNQQVTLTWDPPASDGGSAITNYLVYRDTVPGLGFDAWRDAAPPTPRPSPRSSSSMAYDPGVGEVVLFGGSSDTGGYLADTWVYDTELNTWTLRTPAVSPPSLSPAERSMSFDANERKVSFITWTGSGWQYWAYDSGGNTWVNRPTVSGASYRWDFAFDYDTATDRFYMFGGTCGGGCFFGETWRYEPSTNSWSAVSTTGTPSPRWGHKMAFHPPSGRFVLFGGVDASGYLADTWTYDSSTATWMLKAPPLAPSARVAHRMVYDAASRSIVLFGGSSAAGLRDDTWAYDPVANVWTDLTGSVRPTARYSFGLAYDVGAGKLVLFGGSDGVVGLGDTWTFPGSEPIATLGSVLTFMDIGLTNGVTYYYRVAARNAVGLGPASNQVSASPALVDVEPPTIAVPPNIVTSTDPGQAIAVVTFVATATDNAPGVTVACSPPSSFAFPIGTTTVTCTATDTSGNSATASFTVTVNDVEPPTVAVPANDVTSTDPGQASAVVTYPAPTTSDNSGGGVAVCTPPSGSTFPVGVTTVTCTSTDPSGNTATASFTVTVSDVESPTITVPSDILVSTDPGSAFAVVAYTVTATDNAPGVTVACSPPSSFAFPIGTTTVTCTATDTSGNSATASFAVTVVDTTPPTITVPSDILVSTDPGSAFAVVTHMVSATDNVGIASVVCSSASGSSFPIGTTTVTCTATDTSGNTTTASFTVTVVDTQPPDTSITSAVDGNGAPVSNGGSTLSTSITFTFAGTDNVGVASFECRFDGGVFSLCTSPKSFISLATGAHTFEVRAVDPSGNVDPTPASFSWIILTPAEATSKLVDDVNAMGLPQGVANSLTAPLEDAHKKLTDSNPNNDKTACGKLKDFIDQVNAKENNGQLTAAQANSLRLLANDIKASLGCP